MKIILYSPHYRLILLLFYFWSKNEYFLRNSGSKRAEGESLIKEKKGTTFNNRQKSDFEILIYYNKLLYPFLSFMETFVNSYFESKWNSGRNYRRIFFRTFYFPFRSWRIRACRIGGRNECPFALLHSTSVPGVRRSSDHGFVVQRRHEYTCLQVSRKVTSGFGG